MLAHQTADRPTGQKGVSDMRNYSNYNRYGRESKAGLIIAAIIMIGLLALFVLTLMGMFDEPLWKPDVQIPMTNANVSWSQSFYGGVM